MLALQLSPPAERVRDYQFLPRTGDLGGEGEVHACAGVVIAIVIAIAIRVLFQGGGGGVCGSCVSKSSKVGVDK